MHCSHLASKEILAITRISTERDCKGGFSLVEVAISIAIISFALVAVIGLLPVGLSTRRDSQEEAQAIQNLNAIAACIQGGFASGPPNSFAALAPFGGSSTGASLTWSYKGSVDTHTIYIDVNGNPTTESTEAAEIAFVRITPPDDTFSTGNAYICVAWPGQTARATWNSSPLIPTVTNQSGYVEATIYFRSP